MTLGDLLCLWLVIVSAQILVGFFWEEWDRE